MNGEEKNCVNINKEMMYKSCVVVARKEKT